MIVAVVVGLVVALCVWRRRRAGPGTSVESYNEVDELELSPIEMAVVEPPVRGICFVSFL
jgi:hypothetical protein